MYHSLTQINNTYLIFWSHTHFETKNSYFCIISNVRSHGWKLQEITAFLFSLSHGSQKKQHYSKWPFPQGLAAHGQDMVQPAHEKEAQEGCPWGKGCRCRPSPCRWYAEACGPLPNFQIQQQAEAWPWLHPGWAEGEKSSKCSGISLLLPALRYVAAMFMLLSAFWI